MVYMGPKSLVAIYYWFQRGLVAIHGPKKCLVAVHGSQQGFVDIYGSNRGLVAIS